MAYNTMILHGLFTADAMERVPQPKTHALLTYYLLYVYIYILSIFYQVAHASVVVTDGAEPLIGIQIYLTSIFLLTFKNK